MCKKVLCLSLFVLILAWTNAFAGGSGNCVEPLRTTTEYIGVGGAFEYNYLHERMNDLDNKWGPRDMKVKHLNQVYGKVIVGLSDNFNLYGKIGACNYDLEFIDEPQNATMEIDLETGIYTGAGVNALFPISEMGNFTFGIGADVQGNFFYNDVKGIVRSSETASNVTGAFFGIDGENSIYLTCKYSIENLKTSIIPYIGGYHSWMIVGTSKALSYTTTSTNTGTVDEEHFQPAFDLLSFGFLLGLDVDIAKYVVLNIEGRFGGETALTTGATIKF